MDWATIVPAVTGAIVSIPLAVWAALRHVKKANQADRDDSVIGQKWQGIIDRQDREAERLRDEIRLAREGSTQLSKRVLELELENKIARKVTSDLVEQVRLVKRDKLDPHDLHTNVFTDSGSHLR